MSWNVFCGVLVCFLDVVCESVYLCIYVVCVCEVWIYVYFIAMFCICLPIDLFVYVFFQFCTYVALVKWIDCWRVSHLLFGIYGSKVRL